MGLFEILVVCAVVAIFLAILVVAVMKCYRRVDRGTALVVTGSGESKVYFTNAVVWPFVSHVETIDISIQCVEIALTGKKALSCRDGIRAEFKASFLVRVNATEEEVLSVANRLGCARASDPEAVRALFYDKFVEAIGIVAGQFDTEDLVSSRERIRDEVHRIIGHDLNAFVLEDVAIDYVEIAPLEWHDPAHPRDARGIEKLTKIATAANIATNEPKQEERKRIAEQNLQADERVYALDQQRSELEASDKDAEPFQFT